MCRRVIDCLPQATHREEHHRLGRANRDQQRVRRHTRHEGVGSRAGSTDAAQDHAAGARAVSRIVQKVVVQIVQRIVIIVVVVVAGGDEQTSGLGQLWMERVAGVGVPHLHALARGPGAKQFPRLEDVGLTQAPLVVGVGGGIVRGAASRGLAPPGLCVLWHEVTEQGSGMRHLGLRAQRVGQVPGTCATDVSRGRHDLPLHPIVCYGLDPPAREAQPPRQRARQRVRIAPGRQVEQDRQSLQFGLSPGGGPHGQAALASAAADVVFLGHSATPVQLVGAPAYHQAQRRRRFRRHSVAT